jgi:hypothetical protein
VQAAQGDDEEEGEVDLCGGLGGVEWGSVGGRTLTMTSKMIRGSMAIFSMPMMQTPWSLMYVIRLVGIRLRWLWQSKVAYKMKFMMTKIV